MKNWHNSLAVLITVASMLATTTGLAAVKIPTPTMLPIGSKADAIAKYLKDRSLDPIEGIWLESSNSNEIAIVRAPANFSDRCDFVGVITESKKAFWKPGDVKLLITESATKDLYSVTYVSTGTKTVSKAWAGLENLGMLAIKLTGYSEARYVKIYPKASKESQVAQGPGVASVAAGSGFMLAPTLVATSHHVVRGATAIKVIIGPLAISATVLLQDERNDLAVMQLQPADSIVAGMLNANTTCLAVREDTPAAGERVFAMGFPLVNVINSDIVITEGLISSAVGPNGDLNSIQTTASVQPGSSGGPLLDEQGRVVGVLASTANPRFIYGATGSLPQNVNFAVSTTPLRSMVKFLPGSKCETSHQTRTLNAQGVKALCARAVVRVEVQR